MCKVLSADSYFIIKINITANSKYYMYISHTEIINDVIALENIVVVTTITITAATVF